MTLTAYAVLDSAVKHFHLPFFQQTEASALRSFKALVNDDRSPIFQTPEDYELYEVGTYDGNTGKLSSLDTPKHIAKAILLKKATNHQVEIDPAN